MTIFSRFYVLLHFFYVRNFCVIFLDFEIFSLLKFNICRVIFSENFEQTKTLSIKFHS